MKSIASNFGHLSCFIARSKSSGKSRKKDGNQLYCAHDDTMILSGHSRYLQTKSSLVNDITNMWLHWFTVALLCFYNSCQAADILAVAPQPQLSHQIALRPLWIELAKRGHNITLITTHPARNSTLKNLREIDIGYCIDIRERYNITRMACDEAVSSVTVATAITNANFECMEAQLSSAEGQNLLNNQDNHFDLLITEAQLATTIAFSWKFQVPYIGITSLDASLPFHIAAGNSIHPIAVPDHNLRVQDPAHLSFSERFSSAFYNYAYRLLLRFQFYPEAHSRMKKFFGEDLPPYTELQKNMSMLFVTTNPLFHSVRALMPNTITFWNGLQISEEKPLPKELAEFLDDAKHGAIFFSFGSIIPADLVDDKTKLEIMETFAKLPYKVLWRIKHEFTKIPPNVRVETGWVPQQDILRHPNLKLFINHGGLQSLQEAVVHGVPSISVPFFGDHFMNARRMNLLGYGIEIARSALNEKTLTEAVTKIMTESKYRDKAKEVGEIFKDLDFPSLEKAVWWTEYVIRNKGAWHLQNPALRIPLWQYYLLDVIGIVSLVVFAFFYSLVKMWRLMLRLVLRKRRKAKTE
ncbi:UDP-glucosyltransferase 2-like isoform X2 [Cylas formicarius]|uniref:UDP-glucosyltransferase 2-like isoform X2 n=1 Tax=Cylas formicarius TaxID=197179 RepID=UPI002958763F|nr:UDP-glucosyltransferase 2-like isoform X2 [Cylas formicarius]